MRTTINKALVLAMIAGSAASFSLVSNAYAAPVQDEDIVMDADAMVLSGEDMSEDRAASGGGTIESTQTLEATTSGNVLNVSGDLNNGAITLGSNFGGSGFGTYVLNTGNNSTLNAALTVNVQMTP